MQNLVVIDDDSISAEIISSALINTEHHIQCVASLEALSVVLREMQPQVVIVDLILASGDGIEALELIAKYCPHARVLIVSGAEARILQAASLTAIELGLQVIGTHTKPIDDRVLREQVSTLIESPMLTANRLGPDAISPTQLCEAIDQQQITPYLQPVVFTNSGLLCGFEILARWEMAPQQFVAPDIFIPIAEQAGLINALTISVFEQSLTWFKAFRSLPLEAVTSKIKPEPSQVTLSLNISAQSLSDPQFAAKLEQSCHRYQVPCHSIVLELTESGPDEQPTEVLSALTKLRIKGFGLSIDDFGTGYSSLAQLTRLPFSELKLDGSFISQFQQTGTAKAVVTSTLKLAQSLDLETVAECVETQSQRDELVKLKCSKMQGYLVSPARSIATIDAWILSYYDELEQKRITALQNSRLLDSEAEIRFSRLFALARRLLHIPVSLFSLVDTERQWFKVHQGLDATETHRDLSFCSHAIGYQNLFLINDALQDERFKHNALATRANNPVIFYAGVPISASSGERLGTFCVIDHHPRHFDEMDRRVLIALSNLLERELHDGHSENIDQLTQLFHRTAFDYRARELAKFGLSFDLAVEVVIVDIQQYQAIAHRFGATRIEMVVHAVATSVQEAFRESDLVGRYSPHQMIVMMIHNHTMESVDIEQIMLRLQRILDKKLRAFATENDPVVRLQAGIARLDGSDEMSCSRMIYIAERDAGANSKRGA